MDDFNISDLILFAHEQKPVEFENAFSALILSRIDPLVNQYKNTIASQLFNPEEDDIENE